MTSVEEIADGLLNLYRPQGIILHGSRAVGRSRLHSDWDFILVYEKEITVPATGRERIQKEIVEWKAILANTDAEDIIRTVGLALRHGLVVRDNRNVASSLLKRALKVYASGIHLSDAEISRRRLFLERRVLGLQDDENFPQLFHRHLCIIQNSAVNWWFEILRGVYSEPMYLAIDIIRAEDPKYSEHLDMLVTGSRHQVIKASQKLYLILFGSNRGRGLS